MAEPAPEAPAARAGCTLQCGGGKPIENPHAKRIDFLAGIKPSLPTVDLDVIRQRFEGCACLPRPPVQLRRADSIRRFASANATHGHTKHKTMF